MTILINTKEGETLAEILVSRNRRDCVIDASMSRSVLESLRHFPILFGSVLIRYPALGRRWQILNRKPGVPMNLEQFDIEDEAVNHDLKQIFVAPAPSELPDDGVLRYVAVENVYDFAQVPDRAVAVISRHGHAMLKCVAENTPLFGVRLIVLVGIPDAEYSVDFDASTWNLERASYMTLINDVRSASEIEKQIAAESMSVHDHEKARFTRADGTVKSLADFEMHDIPEGEVDA